MAKLDEMEHDTASTVSNDSELSAGEYYFCGRLGPRDLRRRETLRIRYT